MIHHTYFNNATVCIYFLKYIIVIIYLILLSIKIIIYSKQYVSHINLVQYLHTFIWYDSRLFNNNQCIQDACNNIILTKKKSEQLRKLNKIHLIVKELVTVIPNVQISSISYMSRLLFLPKL